MDGQDTLSGRLSGRISGGWISGIRGKIGRIAGYRFCIINKLSKVKGNYSELILVIYWYSCLFIKIKAVNSFYFSINLKFYLEISKIIDTSYFLKIIIKNPVLKENLFFILYDYNANNALKLMALYNTKFDSGAIKYLIFNVHRKEFFIFAIRMIYIFLKQF